jgi:hypothetical protein
MWSWLAKLAELSDVALTVLAQTRNPADVGRLIWPIFFPRVDADSIRLADITTLDFRPVADHREWGARGRLIPLRTPALKALEMVPIESYFKIGEYEIQRLRERSGENEERFKQLAGVQIPQRVPTLADANFRRIEIAALRAWANGTIVARDPQGVAADYTVSLGIDSTRYVTAPTAWNDAGLNAFNEYLLALAAAEERIGPVSGSIMRNATFAAIQVDTPRLVNSANIIPGRREVIQRIEEATGRAHTIILHEESFDVFTDGGTATTREKVWPAEKVAFIPDGNRVGSTHFAPVVRAFEVAAAAPPEASIDVRGNTVYTEIGGNGRDLSTECQVNAVPIPDEQKTYVVDAGV